MEDVELFSGLDTVLYWAIPFVLALAGCGIIDRDRSRESGLVISIML